jgi:hypothetical protein
MKFHKKVIVVLIVICISQILLDRVEKIQKIFDRVKMTFDMKRNEKNLIEIIIKIW